MRGCSTTPPPTITRELTSEATDATRAIDHESWPLYEADVVIEENTLFWANGFADPETDPVPLYSPGVDILELANRCALGLEVVINRLVGQCRE
jgi:uncharacterized protein YqjF (DUF2071 family)